MKPGFALTLDEDGLTLLARRPEGWAEAGYVGFDAPDLDGRIAALADRARALSPDGFTTKLVLPESQILYTKVHAPGPDRTSRRQQIGSAIDGLTPYEVQDLVYDWSGRGSEVQVAIVARVTLEEAEAFAEAQGFRPVSFVAVPPAGQFAGEPWFGRTSMAAQHLGGEALDRDQDAVRIIADAVAEPAPKAPPEPEAEPEPDAPPHPAEGAVVSPVINIPDPPAAEVAAEPAALIVAEGTPDPEEVLADPVAPPPEDEAPFVALDDLPDEEPPPAFASRRGPAAADAAPAVGRVADGRLTLSLDPPHEGEEEGESDPGAAGASIIAPGIEIPAVAPEPAGAAGGASRHRSNLGRALAGALPEGRHGTIAQQRERRDLGAAARAAPPPASAQGRRASQAAQPSRIRLGLVLVAALLLFMAAVVFWFSWFADAPADQAGTAAPEESAAPAEAAATPEVATAEPDPAAAAADAPAPEPVVEEPDPGPAPPDPATLWADAPAGAAVPEVDATGAPAVSGPTPRPESLPALNATLQDQAASAIDESPSAQPLPPPFGTEIQLDSQGNVVATPDGVITPDGFTLYAGKPPVTPPAQRPGETPALAETAIPAPADAAAGIAPAAGAEPPLAPPVDPAHAARKPAARPAAVEAAAAEAAAAVAAAAAAAAEASSQPAVPAAEPAEATPLPATDDGAALLVPVDPAHAARDPKARPESVLRRAVAVKAQETAIAEAAEAAARAEAEAMAAASSLAVPSSRRPSDRPATIAAAAAAAETARAAAEAAANAAVSDAVTAAVTEAVAVEVAAAAPAPAPAPPPPQPAPAPAPEPQAHTDEVDEPEPTHDAMPNLPTSVTVAKQATIKNALNLGKVNLLGVSGSSANRRALVLLSSGKRIKVRVGDRLDGGKVVAIGDSDLTYVKSGRNYTLKVLGNG